MLKSDRTSMSDCFEDADGIYKDMRIDEELALGIRDTFLLGEDVDHQNDVGLQPDPEELPDLSAELDDSAAPTPPLHPSRKRERPLSPQWQELREGMEDFDESLCWGYPYGSADPTEDIDVTRIWRAEMPQE